MKKMLIVLLLTASHVVWSETMRLPGGSQAFSRIGKDVSLHQDRALVGVPFGPQLQNAPGLVFEYTWQEGTWVKGDNIQAEDGVDGDGFGYRVTQDGRRMVVSAPFDNSMIDETFYTQMGAVYVFDLNAAGEWVQSAKLMPAVAANESLYGWNVALEGNTLMVQSTEPVVSDGMSRDVIYVYELISGSWQLVDTIRVPAGAIRTLLGVWDLKLDNNRLFLNQRTAEGAQRSGKVLEFQQRGLSWVQVNEIQLNPFDSDDLFGQAIAVWQNHLAIAAPATNNDDGAVYMYTEVEGQWVLNQTLAIPTGIENQLFGYDVDMTKQQLYVGSIHDKEIDGVPIGAVYVYQLIDDTWVLEQRLEAEDNDAHSDFGNAISAYEDHVLIGAEYLGTRRGAAYLSTIQPVAEPLPINQGLNGAWFNPEIPGQGIFLDVNATADFAFMGLFSYDTAVDDGLAGQIGAPGQRWLVGSAGIDEDQETIHFDLYYAYDGLFDDDREVQVSDLLSYGWLTMTFKSCLAADVRYHITEPNLSGSFLVTRPAVGSGTLCEDLADSASTAPEDDFNYALNGGWFNLETGGQGLFIDKFKGIDTAFMGWFTFDTELGAGIPASDIGAEGQRWLVGTGELDPSDSNVINYELYYTYGGGFLAAKEVSVIEPGSYGVLRVEFVDCNQARVEYSIGEGALTGSYDMVRSIPVTSGCTAAD